MAIYLITGATGYIGSMLTKHILQMDNNAKVIALIRDKQKVSDLKLEGADFRQIDLSNKLAMENFSVHCDYIIHCASITKSSEMVMKPVEVIESIINTTQNVLELAKRCKVKSVVYLSSMEVYGKVECSVDCRVTEAELGDVELFNTRSCYPLGKRMAENICFSYYKEYGIPVKIARLAQTFGKGILPTENRVFAQFARSVKNCTDIVLHTKGRTMGNYCSIDDAVVGILMLLKCGADGEAYNVVNEESTMTIGQMAEFVSEKIADGKIKVIYDIFEENIMGYASDTGLRLSGRKLMDLGWRPIKNMEEMYREVLEEL